LVRTTDRLYIQPLIHAHDHRLLLMPEMNTVLGSARWSVPGTMQVTEAVINGS
jgi:hypothetical protein